MKITLVILIILALCLLSIAHSFTNNKFSTPEKIFLTFQKALREQNYKLTWQCIAEDSKKKKWHDFKTFKEHSNKHIFNENKIGLLEPRQAKKGNEVGLVIPTASDLHVPLTKKICFQFF